METPKNAPKPKNITKERRLEVLSEIEESGPYSLPIKTLAEKWNCTMQTIYNDVYFWIKKIDITKINEEGKKLLYTIRQGIKLAEQLRKRGSDKDRLKAIEVGIKSAESFTRLMEQYGFKEKIADKVHHTIEKFEFIMEEANDKRKSDKVETEQKTEKSMGSSTG